MNCICDDFRFPPETLIVAGLRRLPRQTGTFAEFRRALLHAVSIRSTAALQEHPLWSMRFLTERDREGLKRSLEASGRWRGRHPTDFGMMLLEMWAYVCDLTSFYDDVLAHESYVRTARRRESLRKLVDPLGYIPRPAVAALAELAAFAEGRQVVSLPVGTAFRSGAFPGSPPQVFELTTEATIHPLLNEWTFLSVRPVYLPVTSTAQTSLLCKPGTVSVKAGDTVIVRLASSIQARRVTGVSDYTGADGENYVRVSFNTSLIVAAGTAYSSVRLLKASAITSQWKRSVNGETAVGTNHIYLDSVNPQIRKGQYVVLEGGGVLQPLTVDRNEDATRTLMAEGSVKFTPVGGTETTVSVPAVLAPVSRIYFTNNIDGTVSSASPHIDVHYAFADAGLITSESLTEIDDDDPLNVRTPIELPRDTSAPGQFQLEDKNGAGLTRPGSLNFATGQFAVQGNPWPDTLVTPVKLFGNMLKTSRGETVKGELIGSGDGAIANQSFTLKKNPLTFLPAPAESTPSGLTSTLKVYVDGLQWTEVTSFYGHRPEDQIYIVRQNDKNESIITFGDGVLGRRLSTGSSVVAYYRHGGGAAMPPAGSITQLAKPFKGLKSVRSPVAPFGGADAEPADSLQKYAPRSALLLGRAVSLADLEAAAASYAGVRAVAAEWRWSSELQVPAAHIWYLADGDLRELILNKLRSLTQPDTPIQVEPAVAAPATLSIQLTHDPKRFEADVVTSARTALLDVEAGLLPPERLGIGKPLFRSRLFEFLLNVAGVTSVTGLTFGGAPFSDFGIKPPAGYYFDFSNGLYLNGRSE
ncbi:MAG: hypothetical protein H0U18_17285 [Pyrinomonadaceae bacterium]|nr:hypothetical protein [Pyrinomonadaceae bacterium]